MIRCDCDEIHLQAIKIQPDCPFLLVNVYACNNSVGFQNWQCFSEIIAQVGSAIFYINKTQNAKFCFLNSSSNKQWEKLENAFCAVSVLYQQWL